MPFHDGLPEILPPSEDGVFQTIFTKEGAKPALLELLSDILGRPLRDVTIRNSEPPISDIDAKREVFDINCVAHDDNSQMDIEMQATPMRHDTIASEHKHIRDRAVLNLSDLHALQPGRGVPYADFYNSYQITICNYNVFNWDNELAERFTYRNERGQQLSDIATAIFVDLTQAKKIVKKQVADMTAVEQWVVFLTKANDPRYRKAIKEILRGKGGISVAYEMLTSISTDENERARFRSRRIWQRDREYEIGFINSNWEKIVADKDKSLADKDKSIADKDAMIAELRAKLDERS
ncbi:MAG: Rpn family recombination-promoting nuclease/putative transposase [Peptococcaceae bacterium]|jgi:predicted transposase/invertase (TIGR01784 family)|nr:Rpn family recombination-promoting nuclease/putative transposase [Peptococcaceae bacterium]